MNLNFPQGRSVAAGEYVMGSLTAEERVEFEAALTTDRELLAEVYTWQDKLLSLALRIEPLEPDAETWAGVEARLASARANAQREAADAVRVQRVQTAANDPLWRRLGLWQAVSGLAVAACLVMATLLVQRGTAGGDAAAVRYLTLLQAPDKSTGWLVEVTTGRGVKLLPLGPAEPLPPGKSLQFWTKAEGAAGPTSLGLVRPGQVTELAFAKLPAVGERQLFELTLEPEGGSPLDRPTGPILYVGRSVRL